MSLRINHNIASVNGHRNLAKNDAMISRSLEKLSSGLRINRAADDAAGLIISEQMRSQIAGTNTAISNTETATSMIQTAEGALDEMNTLLTKARSLALHAANEGVNDQNQLVADQAELDNIVDSVDRIASNTQFGTKKLLDGSLVGTKSTIAQLGSVHLGDDYTKSLASGAAVKGFENILIDAEARQQTGTIGGITDTAVVSAGSMAAMKDTEQFLKAFTFQVKGQTVSVVSGSTKNDLLNQLNAVGKTAGFVANVTGAVGSGAITLLNTNYGDKNNITYQFLSGHTGASTLAFTQALSGINLQVSVQYNTGSIGQVALTGTTVIAGALSGAGLLINLSGFQLQFLANFTTGTLLKGAIDGTGSGATFQIGANVGQTASVDLASAKSSDLGLGGSATYTSLSQLKGSSLTSGNATEAIKVLDKAVDNVTALRGRLGAFQSNTLETTISSLNVSNENLTAAESTIRDVDFAAESANFTKNSILVQASTAMLAQANQLPQNVLKLLG